MHVPFSIEEYLVLLRPGAHKELFVPSKSLFPQSCVSSVIKSQWPPNSNSQGILSPLGRSPDWEICCAHQDPGERSRNPTRDWPRLACERPWVSSGGVGWCWPAAGSGALSVAMPAWNLWRRLPLSSLPPP